MSTDKKMMTHLKTWTEQQIVALLDRSDLAVERAVVAIFNRQTSDEKSTSATRYLNGVGFRSNHASKGSHYARWVNSGKRLTGKHLELARHIAKQYRRQLCEEANSK